MRPKLQKKHILTNEILPLIGRGRDQAITGKRLGVMVGTNERMVRLAISELRKDGWPIIGAISPPYGFYMPDTLDEFNEYVAVQEALIKGIVINLMNVKHAWQRSREVNYQHKLKLA